MQQKSPSRDSNPRPSASKSSVHTTRTQSRCSLKCSRARLGGAPATLPSTASGKAQARGRAGGPLGGRPRGSGIFYVVVRPWRTANLSSLVRPRQRAQRLRRCPMPPRPTASRPRPGPALRFVPGLACVPSEARVVTSLGPASRRRGPAAFRWRARRPANPQAACGDSQGSCESLQIWSHLGGRGGPH